MPGSECCNHVIISYNLTYNSSFTPITACLRQMTIMKVDYPYKPVTSIPDLQYTDYDGARFAYIFWPHDRAVQEQPKGRLLLIHGFGEYTRIQYRLMDHLAQAGYESFTFDQRGAGATSPGKLKGLTDEQHTFRDMEHFVARNLGECAASSTPLYLWGHSMGGGIVLNYALRGERRTEIHGYVASGPLIVLHPHSSPSAPVRFMAPALARCLPRFRIDTGLDFESITSDPRYRRFLQHDKPMSVPLIGSLRQIYDFLERGKRLYDGVDTARYPAHIPLLLQHGDADTINDPKGSERFISNVSHAQDATLKTYAGARHSILSLETDAIFNAVFADLRHWLDLQSSSPDIQQPLA